MQTPDAPRLVSGADAPASDGSRGPLVQLDDVSLQFGGHEAVKQASLGVQAGEVRALIGPSGAGKSSLLRCVNLLEVPHRGRVLFDGACIFDADTERKPDARRVLMHRRQVGMVFQHFNLFPHLSAIKNVELGQVHALNRPKHESRERAMLELDRVGLRHLADAKVGNCSGGQQQRIAIARSLALDPKLMLFDEPTSAIDPELAIDVLKTMRELADGGMTMLIVTHELHFARDVADQVTFMVDGAIVEEGPAEELLDRPAKERTRRFIAAVERQ